MNFSAACRQFSTSATLNGKRNFRKFQIYNKRGTYDYKKARSQENGPPDHSLGVRLPGYYKNEKFFMVPEMIPELVVPDLTDFKLKPYVSYRVADVIQSEFTAEDLFNACYAHKIKEDFKAEKLDESGNPLEPSEEEKMTAEEAWIKARQTGSDIFCPDPPLMKEPEPFM